MGSVIHLGTHDDVRRLQRYRADNNQFAVWTAFGQSAFNLHVGLWVMGTALATQLLTKRHA